MSRTGDIQCFLRFPKNYEVGLAQLLLCHDQVAVETPSLPSTKSSVRRTIYLSIRCKKHLLLHRALGDKAQHP